MEKAYRIRRVEKADEPKVERLLVDDVYDWKPWVWISLRHGMFTVYPKPILGVASALLALGAATGQPAVTLLLSLFLFCLLLVLISWAKMAGICWFMRQCPEFVERNLTEKYAEAGCAFLLAEMGDEIVGCVGIKKRNDKEADLYRMAVSWNCQGLGIGRRLVDAVIDFAAEQEFSTVILRTSHIIQAHLFYEKTGFRIVKYETYWVKKVLPLCVYEMVYSLQPS